MALHKELGSWNELQIRASHTGKGHSVRERHKDNVFKHEHVSQELESPHDDHHTMQDQDFDENQDFDEKQLEFGVSHGQNDHGIHDDTQQDMHDTKPDKHVDGYDMHERERRQEQEYKHRQRHEQHHIEHDKIHSADLYERRDEKQLKHFEEQHYSREGHQVKHSNEHHDELMARSTISGDHFDDVMYRERYIKQEHAIEGNTQGYDSDSDDDESDDDEGFDASEFQEEQDSETESNDANREAAHMQNDDRSSGHDAWRGSSHHVRPRAIQSVGHHDQHQAEHIEERFKNRAGVYNEESNEQHIGNRIRHRNANANSQQKAYSGEHLQRTPPPQGSVRDSRSSEFYDDVQILHDEIHPSIHSEQNAKIDLRHLADDHHGEATHKRKATLDASEYGYDVEHQGQDAYHREQTRDDQTLGEEVHTDKTHHVIEHHSSADYHASAGQGEDDQ
jgi:hypothetical protein